MVELLSLKTYPYTYSLLKRPNAQKLPELLIVITLFTAFEQCISF